MCILLLLLFLFAIPYTYSLQQGKIDNKVIMTIDELPCEILTSVIHFSLRRPLLEQSYHQFKMNKYVNKQFYTSSISQLSDASLARLMRYYCDFVGDYSVEEFLSTYKLFNLRVQGEKIWGLCQHVYTHPELKEVIKPQLITLFKNHPLLVNYSKYTLFNQGGFWWRGRISILFDSPLMPFLLQQGALPYFSCLYTVSNNEVVEVPAGYNDLMWIINRYRLSINPALARQKILMQYSGVNFDLYTRERIQLLLNSGCSVLSTTHSLMLCWLQGFSLSEQNLTWLPARNLYWHSLLDVARYYYESDRENIASEHINFYLEKKPSIYLTDVVGNNILARYLMLAKAFKFSNITVYFNVKRLKKYGLCWATKNREGKSARDLAYPEYVNVVPLFLRKT